MSTPAAPGRANSYLPSLRPNQVILDPAEQLSVHQTLARYAFALDQHDLEALGTVLTQDVTWTFRIADATDIGPIVGRGAILELVRHTTEAEVDQRRHNLVNIAIHSADASTALVHAYLMLTSNAGGGASLIATGFCTFELQHTEGEWRIAELFLRADNPW
jgi:ketosteroid isomerase-like protein